MRFFMSRGNWWMGLTGTTGFLCSAQPIGTFRVYTRLYPAPPSAAVSFILSYNFASAGTPE